jgi:hypothetical protein
MVVAVSWLRLFESIHGHVGILAVAVLIHPAILLRKGRALSYGVRLAVLFTLTAVVIAFSLGVSIYDEYRELVKRDLFRMDPTTGFLFETKEHLAFVVLALVIGASGAALLAPKDAKDVRRAAAATFAAAAFAAAVVAGIGTWVAAVHGFE